MDDASRDPRPAPGDDADRIRPVRDPADPDNRRRLRDAARSLFGDDDGILDAVDAVAAFLDVPGGTVLFEEGDPGDSAYVVLAGRLRAVLQGDGGEQVLSDAVRGETVGELGLITGQPRSATVYAVRDSVVARIGGPDFETLIAERPEAALPIMRILAGRLRRLTLVKGEVAARDRTVAIFPLGGADPVAFASSLAAAVSTRHAVRLVDPADGAPEETLATLLEDHSQSDRVLACVGDREWTRWNARALRHADEVLLLARADDDPVTGPVDAAVFAPRERGGPRITLVLLHPEGAAPTGTGRWLAERPVAQHLNIRPNDPAEIARVARWVTGTSVGLVLGGGGARGWAHLGVLRAFEELGIPIDFVGGTSQGALVGAAVADRVPAADVRARALPLVRSLRDYTLPIVSLLRGRRILRALGSLVRPGIAIEDLWLPYFAIATNLSRAERVVQDEGSVVDAVRASISLPIVLPPVVRDGDLLIDGGLLDNVPVAEMRRRIGTGSIVAIDLSPRSDPVPFDPLAPDVSGLALLAATLLPSGRRRRIPSIAEVAQRTMMAGSRHLRARVGDGDARTLVLRPGIGDHGLLDFDRLDEIADAAHDELLGPLATWWDEVGPGIVRGTSRV